MTFHEFEQLKAKQISKWYHNTHCGQCGEIISQEPKCIYDFFLCIITFGNGRIVPKKYWCKCKYDFIFSENGRKLLEKFTRNCI